jgi:hypothetical protein
LVEVHETETFFGGSTNNHLIKPNSANWELGHPKKAALRNSSKANTHLFFHTPTLSSAKETKGQPIRPLAKARARLALRNLSRGNLNMRKIRYFYEYSSNFSSETIYQRL